MHRVAGGGEGGGFGGSHKNERDSFDCCMDGKREREEKEVRD